MKYYLIDNKYVYLPLNKTVLKLKKEVNSIEIKNIISRCCNNLLEKYDDEVIRRPREEYTFESLHSYNLGIIPTNECNLRCRYCYSETGEKPKQNLSKQQVTNYINHLIKNAVIHSKIQHESVEAKLIITGGGEPTFQWELFKYIVDYFSSKCEQYNIKKKIGLVTNGIMSESHAEYIIENVEQINLSADGFAEIQNAQRPMVNGKESFELVEKFIRTCEKRGKKLLVRATVLAENFHRLTEICDFFFGKYSNVIALHFEPLFYVGRGSRLGENHSQKLMEFMRSYIEVYQYVNEKYSDKNLYNSSFDYRLKEYFCSASLGLNPWLHMDGSLLPCTDYVQEPELQIAKVTDLGITINPIFKKMIHNLKECEKCFAFYHCGGGCPHNIEKDANGNNLNAHSEAYCKMVEQYWRIAITTLGEGKNFCDLESEEILIPGCDEILVAYKINNK